MYPRESEAHGDARRGVDDSTRWGRSLTANDLTLLGSGAVESGGSVGKLKGNEQPLFRGESAGFVNLLLRQHVAKFTGTSRSISPKRRRCDYRLRFHRTTLHGNDMPVTSPLEVVSFHRDTAPAYGRLRATLEQKGIPIRSMDLLIATHALSPVAPLVTNNTREFRRVPGLRLENWV
jgi:hypothetical protein